ncbi:MAG: ATP-binding protein [Deltaproteobacteria bacterium]|nr:ATP-binding protein [Deltaproteobacteria bacterium]
MYSRLITAPKNESFFLFGPRGTGKSSWVTATFPRANYIDLLDDSNYTELLASPGRLVKWVKNPAEYIIVDEVQKIPGILDEVHRLIESKKWKFILTGSSARKLKRGGANLLAGRAITKKMFPLTARELSKDFDLLRALKYGTIPKSVLSEEPKTFLKSYVSTYLKEEIKAEGLTRNVGAFVRFLESASFSQGQVLNVSGVGDDAHIKQKVAESYFEILEDLLLATELPVFSRRAKRKLVAHPKFYFFDVGVFNSIRPRGPLDSDEEIRGISFESFVLQDLQAMNDYLDWEYKAHYWRTSSKMEVDLVLYGKRGLQAIEVKAGHILRNDDFESLNQFKLDYPEANCFLIYGGHKALTNKTIKVVPAEEWFDAYPEWL